MEIREVFGEADIRRMTKVAEVVWREANVSFCSPEQVEYMIEMFQSFEAVSGQLMHGYRYFLVEEAGEILAYFGVQPQGERLFLSKFYILKEHRGKGIFSLGLDYMSRVAARYDLFNGKPSKFSRLRGLSAQRLSHSRGGGDRYRLRVCDG